MRTYNQALCSEVTPVTRADQLRPADAKAADEIIRKGLELNEVIKGTTYTTERFAKALEGLQFSEATVQHAYEHGLQLADDVATPAIGNWTFGSLNMIAQEVGSSLDKDTILGVAFPDKPVPEYKVMLDRIAANTGILPEFGGDSSVLPTIRPLDTYGLTYEPGLWGGRTMLTAKHLMFARKRGESTFADRGIGQLVAYNSVNVVTQAFTRKKYLLNQAIFNNSFIYGGAAIASNIPSGNYIAMYEAMGVLNADGSVTYASSDPLYTPFIAITNILNNPLFLKYRRYIRGIICNGADLQAMMNHPNVKAVTNLMVAGSTSLTSKKLDVQVGDQVKQLNSYYAPSFDFPLLADDDVWEGQNADGTSNNAAQNFFVPRGALYVLLDLTPTGGQNGAFHLTYNEVDPNVESPAMGLFTGVFNRNLENSDTTNRLDIVGALSGAPAVYMPEAQFILTGLYSNV
jgi:hypothetical protein